MFASESIHLSERGRIAYVDENPVGRDFVVGDIHGHFSALRNLLEEVDFMPERDRLFSVGDLVDRGDESFEAIDWLECGRISLAIVGNHEEMMLRALMERPLEDDASAYSGMTAARLCGLWEMNGGDWWYYGIPESQRLQETRRWLAMLESLPYAATIKTPYGRIGMVHSCPMWKRWDDFLDAMEHGPQGARTRAVWSRQRSRGMYQYEIDDEPGSSQGSVPEGEYEGVRAVMAGHTPVEEVRWDANLLNLDSGVLVYGRLSLACVNTQEITIHGVPTRGARARYQLD